MWAPTETGTAMPLDERPTSAGNVRLATDLLGETFAQVLAGDPLDAARVAGELLYLPHHATCVDVQEFR